MNAALAFSHAFAALNEASPSWQPLLRSVLLRAMQDSELQGLLGGRSLWPELWAVGELLLGPAAPRKIGDSRRPRARVSLVPVAPTTELGELLERARRLEAPEREVDEPALARLLTLALADTGFVQHLQSGKTADDFVVESQVRARRRSARGAAQ